MFERVTALWSGTPPQSSAVPVPYDPNGPKQNPLNPQGLKPCCACPQTKSARDDCFLKFDASEADEKCMTLVQEHLACMRSLGFKI